MSFLFPYLTYLIIFNIIRLFILVCLITIVKVQTKFVNHSNLEGNCIYVFIAILSFNKIETTPIFNSHSRLKKNIYIYIYIYMGLGLVPITQRDGKRKIVAKVV